MGVGGARWAKAENAFSGGGKQQGRRPGGRRPYEAVNWWWPGQSMVMAASGLLSENLGGTVLTAQRHTKAHTGCQREQQASRAAVACRVLRGSRYAQRDASVTACHDVFWAGNTRFADASDDFTAPLSIVTTRPIWIYRDYPAQSHSPTRLSAPGSTRQARHPPRAAGGERGLGGRPGLFGCCARKGEKL